MKTIKEFVDGCLIGFWPNGDTLKYQNRILQFWY